MSPKLVPNLLSGLRIFLAPFICWWILEEAWTPALLWSIIAIISDFLDGYLARVTDSKSWLGSKLDPIADKVLLGSIFMTLGVKEIIPLYLVFLVILRDFSIILCSLFIFLKDSTASLKPKFLSKVNTGLQFFLVLLVFLNKELGVGEFIISFVIGLTALTTIGSGVEYLKKYLGLKFL